MPNDRLLYWDSSVFISRIQRNTGRIENLELISAAAESGEIRIVTSAFTLAEVVKTPGLGLLAPDEEQRIVDYFENEYIVVRNVDRFVAERARRIVRRYGVPPADAVHVATAILSDVVVLHTYDHDHLISKNEMIGDPPLRIEEPRWTGQPPLGLEIPEEGPA